MGILSLIVSEKPTICGKCGGDMVRCGEIKAKTGKRKKVYRCKHCQHRVTSDK